MATTRRAQKLSKISGLSVAHGRVLAGVENAGIFESRDGAQTWSLLSTLDGMPGREGWNDPKNQPPGHLGLPGLLPHPDDASRFWAVVQGIGIFETTDDGTSWTPRNRACAPTGRSKIRRSATACTSS